MAQHKIVGAQSQAIRGITDWVERNLDGMSCMEYACLPRAGNKERIAIFNVHAGRETRADRSSSPRMVQ
jgi:hypothetical protein